MIGNDIRGSNNKININSNSKKKKNNDKIIDNGNEKLSNVELVVKEYLDKTNKNYVRGYRKRKIKEMDKTNHNSNNSHFNY